MLPQEIAAPKAAIDQMNLGLGGKFAIFGGIKRRFELDSRNIHHLDVLLGNICRCDVYSNVSLKSMNRKKLLSIIVSVILLIGIAFSLVPFGGSLNPNYA